MNLYNTNGYVDMPKIFSIPVPFIFLIGGRGTGKTYGALETILKEKIEFMFMRRTQSQIDMLNKPEFSPFKPIMHDNNGVHIGVSPVSKYNAAFYYQQPGDEEGSYVNCGSPIGYSCALSTISNMRGFDASECKLLLYDEFIPEKHERPISHEGEALLNAYETINRNRELKGEEPLKLIAMTNANNLNCPVFAVLNLVDTVDRMCRKGQEYYMNKEKGVCIIILKNSPVSGKKRKTALYKLTEGTAFSEMALNNDFANEDYAFVQSKPIEEYRPLCVLDNVCIYKHKSKREYYCVRHVSGNPPVYRNTELDLAAFREKYGAFYFDILSGKMYFADYYCKLKVVNALTLKR